MVPLTLFRAPFPPSPAPFRVSVPAPLELTLTPPDSARVPPELTARLQKMIRRVRRIVWTRGLLATAAVLLGCALAIMAVDAAVLIFSTAVRWGLFGLGLAATIATAASTLVRSLGGGLVGIQLAVKNQKGETVHRGKWLVLMASRP